MQRGRIIGILWLALLMFLALLPEPFKGRVATFGFGHKCAHIAVFTVAFLLIATRLKGWGQPAILGLLLLVFGSALELLQTRVYHIPIEYSDISANAAGILLGFLSRTIWRSNAARDGLEL